METQDIFVVLDEEGFIESWGTGLADGRGVHKVTLPVDSPFLADYHTASYKLVDGSLVLDEKKVLESQIKILANDFKKTCEEENVQQRVPYKIAEITYLFEPITDAEFTKTISLLDNKVRDYAEVTAYDNLGTTVKVLELDKSQYSGLARYIKEVVRIREDKLNNKLLPMIKDADSVEEAKKITWETVPDSPLPEQEGIIVEDTSKEMADLIKENKELKQRVEFNELALMDAINMFSEMSG